MADQRVIVVSESAPKLKELESAAAKRFLSEYAAYENRLEFSDSRVSMKRCLEPEDLSTLLECSDDLALQVVANEEEKDAAEVQMRGGDVDVDDDSESGTTRSLNDGVVVRLSNEHVMAMLIHVLGPADSTEVGTILRGIRMSKELPFSRLMVATNYVRDWKNALSWGRMWRPKDKALIKLFLAGVYPKKLAYTLEDHGFERIETLMKTFLLEYRKGVAAFKTLSSLDISFKTERTDRSSIPDRASMAKAEGAPAPLSKAPISTPSMVREEKKIGKRLLSVIFVTNEVIFDRIVQS